MVDGMAKIRIQDMMNRNKPKGRMAKPPVTHPRTNASNPTTLTDLNDKFKEMKKAEELPVSSKQSEPRKLMPSISETYRHMGEALDMCPYEIQAVFEHKFDTGNVLVRETLKKFIATMKLSGEVDLAPTRKMLREVEEQHGRALQTWAHQCEAADARNKEREEQINLRQAAFAQAWGAIIIDLVQKVDKNPDIESLGGVDQWMVRAIADTDKQAANIDKNGRVALSFTHLKKMEPEKIVSLPELASRMRQEHEDLEYVRWLCKAPISELTHEMNMAQDAKLAELYGNVLMFRKGLRAIHDRWGNVQWYKSEEFDDLVQEAMEDNSGYRFDDRMKTNIFRVSRYDNDDLIHYAYRNYREQQRNPF